MQPLKSPELNFVVYEIYLKKDILSTHLYIKKDIDASNADLKFQLLYQ